MNSAPGLDGNPYSGIDHTRSKLHQHEKQRGPGDKVMTPIGSACPFSISSPAKMAIGAAPTRGHLLRANARTDSRKADGC
jgi:hypothetical protein